jgi:hypothetical protein
LKAGIFIPIILCGIMVLWSVQAFGEEWTAAQKEVWNVIEDNWIKVVEGDLKAIEAGIHDDALSWKYNKETPLKKDGTMFGYERWVKFARPVTYELKPYAIQILGDIANVFYSYKWKSKGRHSGHSRVLMTLKKENGKWLRISLISASCEKLPYCLD